MQAAERIFEGQFDDATEDDDVQMASAEPVAQMKRHRMNVRTGPFQVQSVNISRVCCPDSRRRR